MNTHLQTDSSAHSSIRARLAIVAGAALAPIVPLALTMMPLEELLRKLLGILF